MIEFGAREVGGHAHGLRREHTRLQHDRVPVETDLAAETAQHALGMVAREPVAGHGHRTARAQVGQQDCGLDLRGGDLQLEFTARRIDDAAHACGQASRRGVHFGAERAQRPGDALHRAASERIVAVEQRVEAVSRAESHQQARGRARIACVEGGDGIVQRAAVHEDARAAVVDLRAQRYDGIASGHHVGPAVRLFDG